MKRYNDLFDKIVNKENLILADENARKHKHNWGIKKHDEHKEEDINNLLESLQTLSYKTSKYNTFTIYEPKERVIFRLPYYPDRIVHHAIMNVMEPIWTKIFIDNTYSCIKGRGIHKLAKDLKNDLNNDVEGTKYCLKLDIKKFYPSIKHDILKQIIRRKIKDKKLLVLLDEIIDSSEGVPIGNYLSQFFANLYLTYFDHWLKENLRIKYYYRYCDDIAILSSSKEELREWFIKIKSYLEIKLELTLKSNWQIYPVDKRGIDFVGYRFYHTHTLLRKSIKLRITRLLLNYKNKRLSEEEFIRRMTAYFGWLKHCNSKNFLNKIEKEVGLHYSCWCGFEDKISKFYNKAITFIELVKHNKYFCIHFIRNKNSYDIKSRNNKLYKILTNRDCKRKYIIKKLKFRKHGKSKKNSVSK